MNTNKNINLQFYGDYTKLMFTMGTLNTILKDENITLEGVKNILGDLLDILNK